MTAASPEELRLSDFRTGSLRLYAACAACADLRRVSPPPGRLSSVPVVDLFFDGKLTCSAHQRRPAVRIRIGRWINAMMGEEEVAEFGR